jgi:hypothetical protein
MVLTSKAMRLASVARSTVVQGGVLEEIPAAPPTHRARSPIVAIKGRNGPSTVERYEHRFLGSLEPIRTVPGKTFGTPTEHPPTMLRVGLKRPLSAGAACSMSVRTADSGA